MKLREQEVYTKRIISRLGFVQTECLRSVYHGTEKEKNKESKNSKNRL